MIRYIREFMRLESASGILLLAAAVLAMVIRNSPLDFVYTGLLNIPVEIRIGALQIAKPLLLWVNDGLMAVFFFLIGLEIKREVLEGELSSREKLMLPAIAAAGGMLVPALIYVACNWGDAVAMRGWAIPAATDIAFSLAVLTLLGNRVPTGLKLFLLALAIVDDLGAIVVIALFYTADLSVGMLGMASAAIVVLLFLNRQGVTSIPAYLLVGVVLWISVLKSGVHATLAGVVLAFFIPLRAKDEAGHSPLERLEHDLHPTVAFGILPMFAFCNTGISFEGISLSSFLEPVPIGIALGLFIGKQIGITGATWLAVRVGLGKLPDNVDWLQIYGISIVCGIGFTMSLFIGSLAFEQVPVTFDPAIGKHMVEGAGGVAVTLNTRVVDERLGIIFGSLLSAIVGYLVLRFAASRKSLPPSSESAATSAH